MVGFLALFTFSFTCLDRRPFTMLFHQQQARQSALSNFTAGYCGGCAAWQPARAGETGAHGL